MLAGAGCNQQPTAGAKTQTGVVTAARILAADQDPGNWLTHGRTYSEQRFSPLKEVRDDNIRQLRLAWYYDLDTHRGQESTPLVIDGNIYFTTAWSKVVALDATTGSVLWTYDPKVPPESSVNACCDVMNRGDNLFLSSIVALKPETGEYVWHYQETPGEMWDYTACQQIILDRESRKVLLHAPKNAPGMYAPLESQQGNILCCPDRELLKLKIDAGFEVAIRSALKYQIAGRGESAAVPRTRALHSPGSLLLDGVPGDQLSLHGVLSQGPGCAVWACLCNQEAKLRLVAETAREVWGETVPIAQSAD